MRGPARASANPSRSLLRRGAGGGRAAVILGIFVAGYLLTVTTAVTAAGDVLLEYRSVASAASLGAFAPLSSVNTTAGFGTCFSRLNATLPFGNGSARASTVMVEPRSCATRTLLTFLPAVRFTNGLANTTGHVLDARLDLVRLTGATAMLRGVQVYLQRLSGTNPIITPGHIVISRGAVVTASTSVANVSASGNYGIGFSERLSLRAVSGTATLTLVLVTFVDDGGIVRSVDQERVVLALTY